MGKAGRAYVLFISSGYLMSLFCSFLSLGIYLRFTFPEVANNMPIKRYFENYNVFGVIKRGKAEKVGMC